MFNLRLSYRGIQILLFWIFGFYGWGVIQEKTLFAFSLNVIVSAVIILSMKLLFHHRKFIEEKKSLGFVLRLPHLISAFTITLITIAVHRSSLNSSLTLDEIAYAWAAQGHSYTIFFHVVSFFQLENSLWSSNFLIYFIAFLLISSFLAFCYFLFRLRNENTFLGCVIGATILFRVFFYSLSISGTGHHSPLGFAWSWFFTSIFGLSNTSFRISTIFLHAFLATFILQRIKSVNLNDSLLKALSLSFLFTIPLLGSLSQAVEVANWSLLISVVVLIELIRTKFFPNSEQLLLFALLSYFRIDLAALFLAVLSSVIWKLRATPISAYFHVLPSLTVFIPGFIVTILTGVHDRDVEEGFVEHMLTNMHNAWLALNNSSSIYYLPAFILSVFILMKDSFSRLFVILLMLGYFGLFLVLNESTYSFSSKYLISWFFPLVVVAPFLAKDLLRNRWSTTLLISLALICSLFVGLNQTNSVKTRYREVYSPKYGAISSGYSVNPLTPFPYNEAFKYIKSQDALFCLNTGVVYSLLPEILSRFSIEYVHEMKLMRDRLHISQLNSGEDWSSISLGTLEDVGASCLVVGAIEKQSLILKELRDGGWFIVRKFSNPQFLTNVYVLKRTKN